MSVTIPGGILKKSRTQVLRTMLEEMLLKEQANSKSNLSAMDEQRHEGSATSDIVRAAGIEVHMRLGSSLINLHTDRARGIVAALRRLDRGTYGRCTDCREEIEEKRLNAQPFAQRCLPCQEEVEALAPLQKGTTSLQIA